MPFTTGPNSERVSREFNISPLDIVWVILGGGLDCRLLDRY